MPQDVSRQPLTPVDSFWKLIRFGSSQRIVHQSDILAAILSFLSHTTEDMENHLIGAIGGPEK